MRSIRTALSIVAAIAFASLVTPPANAKPKKPVATKQAKKPAKKPAAKPTNKPERLVAAEPTEQGYAYEFRDDPLYGTQGAANAARIHVRPRGVRNTLLRPRLHFVPELLKSVENL